MSVNHLRLSINRLRLPVSQDFYFYLLSSINHLRLFDCRSSNKKLLFHWNIQSSVNIVRYSYSVISVSYSQSSMNILQSVVQNFLSINQICKSINKDYQSVSVFQFFLSIDCESSQSFIEILNDRLILSKS